MQKSAFDQILKENVIHSIGINLFGYEIGDKRYPNHYNVCAFDKFVCQMREEYNAHFRNYWEGKGNELTSQNGTPPKMASVASSSRFCYLALRKGAQGLGSDGDVVFEHSCRIDKIRGGTPPQMDAYIEKDNIFVEVKCHEIFDAHDIKLSHQYRQFLFARDNDFGFAPVSNEDGAPIVLSRTAFGLKEEQTMLDIKQLICHLLGIQSHKAADEKATLVYLFFKPKVLTDEQRRGIDTLFNDLQDEIEIVFGGKHSPIRQFAEKNNIQLKAIAQYAEVMSPLTEENRIFLFPGK